MQLWSIFHTYLMIWQNQMNFSFFILKLQMTSVSTSCEIAQLSHGSSLFKKKQISSEAYSQITE